MRARTHKPRPPIGYSRRALSGVTKKIPQKVEIKKLPCRRSRMNHGSLRNLALRPSLRRYRPFVLFRCVSQQQQQHTATGCIQSYVPRRGLSSFVVLEKILSRNDVFFLSRNEVTKCKCACFCFDSRLVHCGNIRERAELLLFKL